MDKLKDTLNLIEKWCNDNNVAVFYGAIDENIASEVSWTIIDESDWKKYLETITKISNKILIIDITINCLDNEELLLFKDSLTGDELREFNDSVSLVIKNKEQVASFELIYFSDNVSYIYRQDSEWYEDFSFVQNILLGDDDDDDDDDDNDNDNDNDNNVRTSTAIKIVKLSDEMIEKFARKISSNDKILGSKNSSQRDEIVKTLLKLENITDFENTWNIRRKVEYIYETEIAKKLDEETEKNVLELKAKGIKKVAIASKLNISKDRVNKFYYKDIS
ncbi:MAG: hypothetical protein WC223_13015 [Bacteroidales bacterium]|jgi:hypothetical protein